MSGCGQTASGVDNDGEDRFDSGGEVDTLIEPFSELRGRIRWPRRRGVLGGVLSSTRKPAARSPGSPVPLSLQPEPAEHENAASFAAATIVEAIEFGISLANTGTAHFSRS